MTTVRLGSRSVHLIGSVHSTSSCISEIRSVTPTHVFVEATKDVIALIKRNPKHSPRLLDLPSVVQYTEDLRLPLHAIDTSVGDISNRVLRGYTRRDRGRLWKYLIFRSLYGPLAHLAFVSTIDKDSSILDAFVTRWGVSRHLLQDCRCAIERGASINSLVKFIEERQDLSSFLASADYDPSAYMEVCQETEIDKRLQSVVIDYRNDFMCHQVRRIVRTIPEESQCAIIVGKNHVEGMAENFSKGLDYLPEALVSDTQTPDAKFIDKFLLAQLLRS